MSEKVVEEQSSGPGPEYYDDLNRIRFHCQHYECPFPKRLNPFYSKKMERNCCQQVIDECGLEKYPKLVRKIFDAGWGFSVALNQTEDRKRLENIVKWIIMFFVFDEMTLMNPDDLRVDDQIPPMENHHQSEYFQQMMDMLDRFENNAFGRKGSDEPERPRWPKIIESISKLMSEVFSDYTAEEIKRSMDCIRHMIRGFKQENDCQQKHDGQIPDWPTYMDIRSKTVGAQMCVQLVEYGKNIHLTEQQINHPLMKQCHQLFALILALVNDYYSFRKEVAEADFKFSRMLHPFPVLVQQGLSLQQAVDEIHRMIVEKDQQMIELIEEMKANQLLNSTVEQSHNLSKFLLGIEEYLGNNWVFSITCQRYHGRYLKGALPPGGYFVYDRELTIIVADHYPYEWYREVPEDVPEN